jgi:hypothetical protein
VNKPWGTEVNAAAYWLPCSSAKQQARVGFPIQLAAGHSWQLGNLTSPGADKGSFGQPFCGDPPPTFLAAYRPMGTPLTQPTTSIHRINGHLENIFVADEIRVKPQKSIFGSDDAHRTVQVDQLVLNNGVKV